MCNQYIVSQHAASSTWLFARLKAQSRNVMQVLRKKKIKELRRMKMKVASYITQMRSLFNATSVLGSQSG